MFAVFFGNNEAFTDVKNKWRIQDVGFFPDIISNLLADL